LSPQQNRYLDIIEKIKDIDCYLKSITASRPAIIPENSIKEVEIKRDVSHEFALPGDKSDHFSIEVTDRITFTPDEGPFQIEVIIGASIVLIEALSPGDITNLISTKKNILSLINQCLPHSSAIIAHITDKMGFSPMIFSSRIALREYGINNESRLSNR